MENEGEMAKTERLVIASCKCQYPNWKNTSEIDKERRQRKRSDWSSCPVSAKPKSINK